jgi:peptide/nickel transport system substrate-binding protein
MKIRTILAGAAMALAAVGATAVQAQPDKTQLVVGQLQFLTNFHPLIQVNNTKRLVSNYGLRPITAYDETVENQCVLCETLPTLDNGLVELVDNGDGTQGMRVKMTFKEGLAWGDGTPVTTKDVVFTHKMAADPNIGFSNYNPWTRASSVEVVDDRTFVLVLPALTPSYASWDQVLPAHLEEPVYEANPNVDAYIKQTLYNTDPTNPGLWNGSFMLANYQIGTRLIWEPNPHWPGEKPGLDRVVLSYRDNSSALMQNLLSGEIDAVPVSPGGISFSQMLDVQSQNPDDFTFHIADGTNLERIAMNFDNPILADVKVRQALLYAIDRQSITEALFAGQQAVANGLLATTNPFYSSDIKTYAFDPEQARSLLSEAGWTPGSDGICTNDAGDRLSLDLVTTAGNQTREQIAQVIQSLLKDVCVEITNKFVPLTEFNGEQARRRAFTGLMMSSIDFSPSTSPRIALGSDQVPTPENKFVGNNFSGYRSDAMDAALEKYDMSLTTEESKAAWAQIQDTFAEDLPMLPLYFYARAYVSVPDLKNFRQATYDPLMIWSEEWTRE